MLSPNSAAVWALERFFLLLTAAPGVPSPTVDEIRMSQRVCLTLGSLLCVRITGLRHSPGFDQGSVDFCLLKLSAVGPRIPTQAHKFSRRSPVLPSGHPSSTTEACKYSKLEGGVPRRSPGTDWRPWAAGALSTRTRILCRHPAGGGVHRVHVNPTIDGSGHTFARSAQ